MTGTKWVATVTDRQWLVAKVKVRKFNIKVIKVKYFTLKDKSQEEEALPDSLPFSSVPQDFNERTNDGSQKEIVGAGSELKRIFKRKRIPNQNMMLSISCPGVITRIVTVPVMKKKLLDELFSEQVDQYFTLNVVDYLIDYKVLATVEEEGQKRFKVLLAAMPREVWYWQWQVLQEAKIKPKIIDIQFECLTRLYSTRLKQLEAGTDVVIVDLSEQRAEIIILEHGEFFLYSDVNINSQALNELLWHQSQVSSEDKEKNKVKDKDKLKDKDEINDKVDNEENIINQNSDELFSLVKDTLDTLDSLGTDEFNEQNNLMELENLLFPVMQNISEFMNFFSAKHFGKNVDTIYITGKFAVLEGVAEIFKTNLEIETKIGYPGDWKPKFSRKAARLKIDPRSLGSIIGLALRED